MADLARLAIHIESTDALTASERLDALAVSAGKAQNAVDRLKSGAIKGAGITAKLDSKPVGMLSRVTAETANKFDLLTRNMIKSKNGIARYTEEVKKATKATSSFEDEAERVRSGGRRGATSFNRWARAAGNLRKVMVDAAKAIAPFFALFAGLRAIGSGIRAIADFEFAMAQVRGVAISANEALTDLEQRNFAQLSNQARELGASTRFTAVEVAEGQLFLARAGFEANEILTATPAVLNLAAAGVLDLARAADIASNVLQQFNLEVAELTRVTDVMVTVANSSNTTVEQMAEALKIAGPVAGSLGIQVETAAAAIGLLGNAGIQATLAGTQLRGIFAALADPTREAGDLMERLAASSGMAADSFDLFKSDLEETEDPLIRVLKNLNEAGAGVEEFFQIFGRRQASGGIHPKGA